MPRPKSELTKSGRTIGVRLTQSEYEQWVKLGASKWLRKLLQEKKDARVDISKRQTPEVLAFKNDKSKSHNK